MFGAGLVLCLPALLGAAASVVVRLRRVGGIERQQLQWVAYGGAIAVPLPIVTGTGFDETVIGEVGTPVASALIPVCISVALFRYRLYDIDRLINRTIVYGLASAGLAAIYILIVIALPLILPSTLDSPLAVAVATVVVFTLFRPVTRRVQGTVDRRLPTPLQR